MQVTWNDFSYTNNSMIRFLPLGGGGEIGQTRFGAGLGSPDGYDKIAQRRPRAMYGLRLNGFRLYVRG